MYMFAYMCAVCICVYLYASVLGGMSVLVCIYVNSKKKKNDVLLHTYYPVLCIRGCK